MQEAFLKNIGENRRIIHKISRMYRDNREDQEDLYQEIVFQLWKAFPLFRGEAKASTWIYRVALNTAIATFRKTRPAITYSDDMQGQFQPFDKTDISENEERMYIALRQLNDSEKAIISLFLEDYSYQEIARITGITENYVGVRMSRIKDKLKQILNPQ